MFFGRMLAIPFDVKEIVEDIDAGGNKAEEHKARKHRSPQGRILYDERDIVKQGRKENEDTFAPFQGA